MARIFDASSARARDEIELCSAVFSITLFFKCLEDCFLAGYVAEHFSIQESQLFREPSDACCAKISRW